MSKAVKGVTRAIGKVVGGAKKILKKVFKNKFVRIIAIAVAAYFTAGAALGALGTIGTSTSLISGAASGISSAASGLVGAGTALAGAGTTGIGTALGNAGTALMNGLGAAAGGASSIAGFTGSAADTIGATVSKAGSALFGSTPAQAATPTGVNWTGNTITADAMGTGAAPGEAAGSFVTQAAKQVAAPQTGFFSSPYVAPALINAGGRLVGGYFQGRAAQEAQENQQALDEEERRRRNTNWNMSLINSNARLGGR